MSKEGSSLLEQSRYAAYLVDGNGGMRVDHGAKGLGLWQRSKVLINVPKGEYEVIGWEVKDGMESLRGKTVGLEKVLIAGGVELATYGVLIDSFAQDNRPESGMKDIFGMSRNELILEMRRRTEIIYDMTDVSLHVGHEHGFNRHGIEHIDLVCKRSLEVLDKTPRMLGETDKSREETAKVTIIATYLHDVGNLLSRKLHSLASARMAKTIVPELTENPELHRRVRRAIELHNEPIAEKTINEIKNRLGIENVSQNPEMFYRELRERFGLESLALLVADKSHAIDRQRVSDMILDGKAALNADIHYEISLLAKSKKVDVSSEKPRMKLNFKPKLRAQSRYSQLYADWNKPVSRLEDDVQEDEYFYALVSDEMERKRKEDGIPYFYQWTNNTIKHNIGRFELLAMSAFALNPAMQHFDLEFKDSDGFVNKRDGVSVVVRIERNDPSKGLMALAKLSSYDYVQEIHGEIASRVLRSISFENDQKVWKAEDLRENGLIRIRHRFSRKEEDKVESFVQMMYGQVATNKNDLALAGD